jgi:hypothetical protein
LNKFHYIVLLIAIVTTVSQTAADTTIAGLDTSSMGVSPTPTPTPTATPTQTASPFGAEVPTPSPSPSPSPDPTVPITNLQPDINTLFKALLTQELNPADRVVLTTELERLLDELVVGQSQISVEFEDYDGEESEPEKTFTITVTPIGATDTPITEDEPEEDDEPETELVESDNGDDNGDDDPPEESPDEIIPGPPSLFG